MENRNNQERLGLVADSLEEAQQDQVVSEEPKPKTNNLEFWNTATTEFVDLPSEGKFYSTNHPLSTGKAEIKTMTAFHEDILANKEYMREGILFDRFIQAILVESVDPTTLLEGDRMAIMIAARSTAYGNKFQVNVPCSTCRTTNKVNIDIGKDEHSNLKVQKGILDDNLKDVFDIQLNDAGNIEFTLPQSKVTVESKISTGELEKQLYKVSMWKKKQGFGDLGIVDQMKKIIVSANGLTDRTKLEKFFNNMPARDAKYWRDTYKMAQPNVKLIARQECVGDYCTNIIEEEVGLSPQFFWPRSEVS